MSSNDFKNSIEASEKLVACFSISAALFTVFFIAAVLLL